ncbi:MAG: hypothetical protein HRT87_08020 [Legionellales bacterium]|nr:hypothetical protein [Legionellales bacterium]
MSLVKDLKLEIVRNTEETLSDVELNSVPVSKEDASKIEQQLAQVYLGLIDQSCREKIKLERVVKAPLYLAAMEYFKGDKNKISRMFGFNRKRLFNVLIAYFKTSSLEKLQAAEKGNRLYFLYLNYLGQFYVDSVDQRFVDIVNRAKLIALMEYYKDKLYFAANTLGVRESDLKNEIIKYFGDTKLCADKLKEVG